VAESDVNPLPSRHSEYVVMEPIQLRVTLTMCKVLFLVAHVCLFVINPLDSKAIIVPHRVIGSWYTGR